MAHGSEGYGFRPYLFDEAFRGSNILLRLLLPLPVLLHGLRVVLVFLSEKLPLATVISVFGVMFNTV